MRNRYEVLIRLWDCKSIKMHRVDVCVGCLATDVRMYSMSASGLLQPYRLLAGLQIEGMPDKLCWECAAFVNKFNTFRRKCERAHLLLRDIYTQHQEFYEEYIKRINRHEHSLISFSKSIVSVASFIPQNEIDNTRVNFDHTQNDDCYMHFLSDCDDVEIKKEDVEVESNFDCNIVDDMKSVKKLRRIKKKTKRERRKEEKNSVVIRDKLMENGEEKDLEKHTLLPRKYQPNMKIDCSPYAVEVVLTQEQQMEEVRKRQETLEYKEARYKCNQCFRGYSNERTYKTHMLKHDPVSGPYQCDVCKHRYRQRRHVVNHIYKVHMSKFNCRLCNYVSQSPEQANNHNKWHTGVTYKCELCGEIFTKRSTHLSHVRIKHPSQHICGACGESFVSARGLVLHTSLMHKDGVKMADGPYCVTCGVQFASRAAYHKHVLISPKLHSDRDALLNGCRECGECFDTEQALREHHHTHAKRRRRQPAGRPVHFPTQCQQCPVTVENATQYWQHFRRAHPDHKYPAQTSAICEYCGKGFQTNALLAYHRYTHTDTRAHRCPVPSCDKRFHTRGALAAHARAHDDARPHVCRVCRKGFKIHTGEKPYSCEVCGKAFSDASGRKLHVRTVHLKEPSVHRRLEKDSYFVV